MSGKVICSFSVVLMLGLMMSGPAQAGDSSLVGWWKLDDGSGTIAIDSSGYGNHGTLEGSPEWKTAGDDVKIGSGSLYFDFVEGGASDYVDCGDKPEFDITDNITLALWVKSDGFTVRYQYFFSKDTGGGGYSVIRNAETRNCRVVFNGLSGQYYATGSTVIDDGQWHHLAASYDSSTGIVAFYTDGLLEVSETASGSIPTNDLMLCIGGRDVRNSNAFIDDARIYNRTLSEEEIQVVMEGGGAGFPLAMRPDPEDGAMLEATWVTLSWRPGSFAVSHDVYFGTSFDDVNEGTEGTYFGNTSVTFQAIGFPGFPAPDGLLPGTTYYWRIDEVNDANAASPWKGNVWSFWIPPKIAYEPDPADDAKFVAQEVTLSWTTGFVTKLHHVYFGDNFDDISNATGALPQSDATFTPGTLELGKSYYWRVDEFDGDATHKGDVWSFTTIPDIAVTDDPDLVGWWTLDEGMGETALDWSGHGNHATLVGPEWIAPGLHGDAALNMAGGYAAIQNLSYANTDLTEVTVCAWIRTSSSADQYIVSFDRNEYYRLEIGGSGGGPGQVSWDVMTSSGQIDYGSITRVDDGAWHHLCGVYNAGTLTIYIDGSPEPSATGGATYGSGNTRFGFIGANSEATSYNGSRGGGSPVAGDIDDVRIYSRALTQEETVLVMRSDPLLAWAPSPSNGSTPDVDNATPLTWSAGDSASSHEVYFGIEEDAVKNADTSDTTGIYRGSQSGTSYTPEGVEWGAGPFYWRIDENNTDGTVTKGRVWSFAVADFILVDDFEIYDANDNQIWYAWHDGLGYGTPGVDPYFAGNGTGAAVGDETTASYTEETIVHGGNQSMPISYDNNKQGYAYYSEVEHTLTNQRDWTEEGVTKLSLWFHGASGNEAERMFVALNGSAVVYHDDPAVTQMTGWKEWIIDLQAFADQGVNLADVNSITIGFGTKNNPAAGGAGQMYFDDIRLYR